MKFILKSITLTVLFFMFSLSVNMQTNENSVEAAKRLRELYFLHDYDQGITEGEKFSVQFSGNSEVYAWYLAHKSKLFAPKTLEGTREFAEKNENDLWANFALTTVFIAWEKYADALEASEKMAASENEDFILARAYALVRKGKTAEALKLLNEKAVLFADRSRVETALGEVYYFSENVGDKQKAFAFFDAAQKSNPQNLEAFLLAGIYLNREKRFDEAIKPLRRATKISPSSYFVRQSLWNALFKGQAKKSSRIKQKEIAAEIEKFRKQNKDGAKLFLHISDAYSDIELPDKKKNYEELLLKNFSDSPEAEKILIYRVFRFSYYDPEKKQTDAAKLKQYAAMIAEFLKRPRFFNEEYLGMAYANYLYAVKEDKTVSDEEYLRLGAEAVKYPSFDLILPFPMLVDGLLKRGKYAEAEQFARNGLDQVEERFKAFEAKQNDAKWVELERRNTYKEFYRFLGNTLLKQKKYEEAEENLLHSLEYGREYNSAMNLLGELYEETGDFEKAEKYYIETIAFSNADEPDYSKLKGLYEKRNKNADEFDKYLEKIKPFEKQMRREYIVSNKDKKPFDLAFFDLKTADGKPFSSENIKGKVVVINIWTTWCGPCVQELPDFQELHKKYESDKDVAVLTINSKEDAETINKFMLDKKFDFPVIMSGEYTNDVNVFPTTWFVDRNGKIIYTKIGFSKNLLEEFDWRIEELRRN